MSIVGAARGVGLGLAICGGVSAPARSAPAEPPSRQINITSDSAPGWLPSVEQEGAARRSLDTYLAAVDNGQPGPAYAVLTPGEQYAIPLGQFARQIAAFLAQAGPLQERRILRVTWTKNPAKAPTPGVYVAFDLASRFAKAGLRCDYIVLYQSPAGGDFQVSREEDLTVSDAAAAANCPPDDAASAAGR